MATLSNPVGTAPNGFGSNVAISGDGKTVLVGDTAGGGGGGAVYVYHVSSEGNWTGTKEATATLTNALGAVSDSFGTALALSSDGTTAFVGALGANSHLGAIDVFHVASANSWVSSSTPGATLTNSAETANGSFGQSISLSGDGTTVLIGDGAMQAAHIYHTASESTWASTGSPTATLTAPDGPGSFGATVALSLDGGTAVIGSLSQFPLPSVCVFHSSSEGQWIDSSSPNATLSDTTASGVIFGSSVAVSSDGTTVLVGAEGANYSAGFAAIYLAPSANLWADANLPIAVLTDGTASGVSAFGGTAGLSSDGSTALIGNPGYDSSEGAVFAFTNGSGTPPPPTTTTTSTTTIASTTTTTQPTVGVHGYWLVGSDGGIFSFGSAQFYGSTGSLHLQRPVVGMVPTTDREGYWLDASDGGIFAFGDSGFYGSLPGLGLHPAGSGLANSLAAPIVGMVSSADGHGYFMVASDGGVFAFGDARFAGSCPGIGGCVGAAVAVMPDASGNGYWLITSLGYVYGFGDAVNYGGPGSQSVPVTSAVRTPDGQGYWVLFANGAISRFGDAGYFGSPAGQFGGFNPATAIIATADSGGYWVASAAGAVDSFGDAPNDGSMTSMSLNGSIIAATGW